MTRGGPPMSRGEAASLLGVDPSATAPEVQRAYLRAARTAHPDLVPEEDVAGRREAGEAFDRLTRAREVLLTALPDSEVGTAGPRQGPSEARSYRPAQGRGLGGSLVVLALLAFLLVALVSLQQGLGGVGPPAGPAAPAGERITTVP